MIQCSCRKIFDFPKCKAFSANATPPLQGYYNTKLKAQAFISGKAAVCAAAQSFDDTMFLQKNL
jgi:hypothetical protein